MTSITGSYNAGVLAGVFYAEIDRFSFPALNAGRHRRPCRRCINSTVNNVFSSVAILMGNNQGGLIGRFDGDSRQSVDRVR